MINWTERTFEALVREYLLRVDERRVVAYQRVVCFIKNRMIPTEGYQMQMLELGRRHGEANNRTFVLEEELIARVPGQQLTLESGRTVKIGSPGCRLYDRLQVVEPEEV